MKLPNGKLLFFPYLLFDYPSREQFLELLDVAEQHADCIEIGIPFSDPVADGPVIASAAHKVLQRPFDLDELFSTLLKRKGNTPIALMTYANPICNYGLEAFCEASHETKIQALIVPDIPFEESKTWEQAAIAKDLSWISFVSLFTKEERLRKICTSSSGFIYLVSVAGITGAKMGGLDLIRSKATQIRECTDTPIALGFGIRSIDDAMPYRDVINAFIVGTKIIEIINESNSVTEVEKLFSEFSEAK